MSEFGSVTSRRGRTVPYGLAMSSRAVHSGETQTPLGRCSQSGVRLGLSVLLGDCMGPAPPPAPRHDSPEHGWDGPRLSYSSFSRRGSVQQHLNSFCMSCLQSVWLKVRFCAFDDNIFFGSGSFSSVAPSAQPLHFPPVLLTPSLPLPVCTPTSLGSLILQFLAWSDWGLLTPSLSWRSRAIASWLKGLSLQTEGSLRAGPGQFGFSLPALGACSRYTG